MSAIGHRHDLIWLTEQGRQKITGDTSIAWHCCPEVPLIRAREDEVVQDGALRVGLALPEKHNGTRLRHALIIEEADIAEIKTPWEVADSMRSAASCIGDLLRRLSKYPDLKVGIYGSAALEWVSGYTYRTETSDLDLIVTGRSKEQLYTIRHLIPDMEQIVQCPIDVDLRIADTYDVKLKEFCSDREWVLVKSVNGAELMRNRELEEML